jgi:hypothetical protein
MYCIDNWNRSFDDNFFVLGLYLNGVVIGFSEMAYFVKERFVIVDYIVVNKNFRGNHTFFQFISDIQNFLSSKSIEYNYIVAEVGCYNEGMEPPEASKLLIRLLKIAHFGVVKCNYYVPRVGNDDFESQMRAIMMIYSLNEAKQIRRDTFFQIVNAIYYKYYQRWHNIFNDKKEQIRYDNEIKELVEKMEKQLVKRETIEINGLNGLFPITLSPENEQRGKKLLKLGTFLILFILSFISFGITFLWIKSKFGVDSGTITTLLSLALGISLFFTIWIFEKRSKFLYNFLQKVIDKY